MSLETVLYGVNSYDECYNSSDFIITPDMRASIDSHQEWANAPYAMSGFKPWKRNKVTSRGLKVRTKGEVGFCQVCYAYDLPFRYEQVLMIGGIAYAPDFTFEEASRDLLRVEYCGMMDDLGYVQRHLQKLRDYASVGIIPGMNLICIYDKGDDINLKVIDDVVRNQIIPRL